jgi:hypothetical protein
VRVPPHPHAMPAKILPNAFTFTDGTIHNNSQCNLFVHLMFKYFPNLQTSQIPLLSV